MIQWSLLFLFLAAFNVAFFSLYGNNDRVGSLSHTFDVPEQDRFRTSSPLLTDQLQEGAGRPRPVLRVRRDFSQEATLYCEFEVNGAARDETGVPRVSAGYLIRHSDGTVFLRARPNPIRPSSLGQLSRLVGASLRGAAPGEYELVLMLEDEVAGESLEVREPFSIAAPSSP